MLFPHEKYHFNMKARVMEKRLNDFQERRSIYSIDGLRGLAACAVMLFHFTANTTIHLSSNNPFSYLFKEGHYGVEVFFLISGFVIPYSLYRNGCVTVRDFYEFMKKRVVRIDIPYVSVIVLELALIGLSALTPWGGSQAKALGWENILLHLGYLNSLTGHTWLLPIFWTLAIEFQFYLLIALAFPLMHMHKLCHYLSILLFVELSLVCPDKAIIFNHLIFFAVGVLLYYYKTGKFNIKDFLIVAAVLFITIGVNYGFLLLCFLVVSCFAIVLVKKSSKVLSFLGKISFAIYLLHIPIGGRLLALAESLNFAEPIKIISLVIAIIITIICSYIFYQFIEMPAIQLSKRLATDRHNKISGQLTMA